MLHAPFATVAVVFVVFRIGVSAVIQTVMVLVTHEIRQTVVPGPGVLTGDLGPLVVIPGLATNVEHAVDTGTTSQGFAPGVDQRTPVKAGVRVRAEAPVGARVVDTVEIAHRNVDPVVVVPATGFDQQYPVGRICTEAVGEQAAGGAGTYHDVVELLLSLCLFVVGHGVFSAACSVVIWQLA